jgi:hypothetical protein
MMMVERWDILVFRNSKDVKSTSDRNPWPAFFPGSFDGCQLKKYVLVNFASFPVNDTELVQDVSNNVRRCPVSPLFAE